MDEKDRLLLTYLLNGLPLTPRPFDGWASKLGTDNADLLLRIQRLKKEGTVGEIHAILDPQAFQYQSAWVAMRIGQEHPAPAEAVANEQHSLRIGQEHPAPAEAVANEQRSMRPGSSGLEARTEALWQHPGVIYGCEREHEFNIWFFVAAPADHDLELHVSCLEKLSAVQATLFLPVRRVFKGMDLSSFLNAGMLTGPSARSEKRQKIRSSNLTPEEIGMIRELQKPLPLTDEPYQRMAVDLEITEGDVLERIKSLVRKGCLKRIGSSSKTFASAPEARTLVVWQIPEEKLERLGPEISAFREVLYADRRPAYPEFPYSLYTMIRAESAAELEVVTRRMQDRIGKWPHRVLVTVREFKKEPMRYFPKELDLWWQQSRQLTEAYGT